MLFVYCKKELYHIFLKKKVKNICRKLQITEGKYLRA